MKKNALQLDNLWCLLTARTNFVKLINILVMDEEVFASLYIKNNSGTYSVNLIKIRTKVSRNTKTTNQK